MRTPRYHHPVSDSGICWNKEKFSQTPQYSAANLQPEASKPGAMSTQFMERRPGSSELLHHVDSHFESSGSQSRALNFPVICGLRFLQRSLPKSTSSCYRRKNVLLKRKIIFICSCVSSSDCPLFITLIVSESRFLSLARLQVP